MDRYNIIIKGTKVETLGIAHAHVHIHVKHTRVHVKPEEVAHISSHAP